MSKTALPAGRTEGGLDIVGILRGSVTWTAPPLHRMTGFYSTTGCYAEAAKGRLPGSVPVEYVRAVTGWPGDGCRGMFYGTKCFLMSHTRHTRFL
jgi:hypothetical protein